MTSTQETEVCALSVWTDSKKRFGAHSSSSINMKCKASFFPFQPLDFETKRRFVMAAEAVNDHADTRFLPLDEFSDRTTLKIVVEDVDEPPVFLSSVYKWKVPENVAVGTPVGSVAAKDSDAANAAIR